MNSKQLMSSILQQAMQGQLVPQLDIEPEVAQVGPAPAPDTVPFAIPAKWKWVQLDDITIKISDGTHNPPPNAGSGIPVLSAKNIDEQGNLQFGEVSRWAQESDWVLESQKISIKPNDVLLTIVGSIGRAAVVTTDAKFILQRSVAIIKPQQLLVDSKFLRLALISPYIQGWLQQKAVGTAQKGVYLKSIKKMLLPLPSLEEQHRIVAKIEEIQPLVESLWQAQDKLAKLEADFPRKLKASLLQQAISGQLVPQLDTEPEFAQLGPAPAPYEVPFELPPKWKWVQAQYLGDWKSGGTPLRSNPSYWEKGTVPWLKTGEVSNCLVSSVEEKVTEKAVKETRLRLNPAGSVLVAMYGTGTVGNIGMLGIPSTTNQACCACVTDPELVVNWYLFYVLMAFRYLLIKLAAGTTNLQNLSKSKIEKIWIPLPPLDEQRRIVAKLDELLPEVDKLGSLLKTA